MLTKWKMILLVCLPVVVCTVLIFLYEVTSFHQQEGNVALHAVAPYSSSPISIALEENGQSTDTYYVTNGSNFWKVVLGKMNGSWAAEHVQSVKQLPKGANDTLSAAEIDSLM